MTLTGRGVLAGSARRSRAIRSIAAIVCAAATIGAVACTEPVAPADVATIVLAPLGDSVEVGASISNFIVALKDKNGNDITGRTITWTSANQAIATVDANGAVSGVAVGQTLITAKAGGKSANAAVKVLIPVASIAIQPESLKVPVLTQNTISVQLVGPAGEAISGRTLNWSSANPALATVSPNGVVSGLAQGQTTVTVRAGSKSATARVFVTPEPVNKVIIQPDEPVLIVRLGQTRQISAQCQGISGNILTGRALIWTSSNPLVASVGTSSGLISGVALGSAVVSANCDGVSDQVTIQVTQVPISTVSITPGALTMQVGQQQQLAVTVRDSAGNPLSTAGRQVIWISDNLPIATVSGSGVVQGVAAGSANVNVSVDGIVSPAIVVTVQNVPVASVTVTPNPATLALTPPGASVPLSATLRDANGNVLTNRPITWRSLNPARAIVSPAGVVTPAPGATPGTVTIEAECEGVTGTALVNITP